MIFVNFKTYPVASGSEAVSLMRVIKKVSEEEGIRIIACPQLADRRYLDYVNIWAQHVDPQEPGQSTGWITIESLRESGFRGTLLNHSEHKLSWDILEGTVKRCKEFNFQVLVFAASVEEAIKISKLKPDWIGYEPPELIASKDTSVARSKPDIIENVVKAIPNIPILVGAGVKDKLDVEVSLKLGAKAVGVSSAVVLAENQEEVLRNLAKGFKK